MIKAGNHTVSDKGFTVVTENIGGVPRQAVVAELPGRHQRRGPGRVLCRSN